MSHLECCVRGGAWWETSDERSRIKSQIVAEYFPAWARILLPRVQRFRGKRATLLYLDLFAGRGRFEDGTESTPLLILRRASADPGLRAALRAVFVEEDPESARLLAQAIRDLPDIGELDHEPRVYAGSTGADTVQQLIGSQLPPTLAFLDPWGYRGLTLDLVRGLLRHWGTDVLVFFNYNRVNSHLSNPQIGATVEGLFGAERADALRQRLLREHPHPGERRDLILHEMEGAIRGVGGKFQHRFHFPRKQDSGTSHYLLWISKNPAGLSIIRDITGKLSSSYAQGVPSFGYEHPRPQQQALFPEEPIRDLAERIYSRYSGRTMLVRDLVNEQLPIERVLERNVKEALLMLEADGRLVAETPAQQRPRRSGKATMADHLTITFS